MTFNQLIFRNIRRQPRVFLSYFFSHVFSVTIFFIASMLYFHPLLQGFGPDGNMRVTSLGGEFTTKSILGYSLLLIACLSLLFLGTMFRLYVRERGQNFAIYSILGMTQANLKKMLILENGLICIFSLVIGLLVGTIFSKLFLLIVQNILGLDHTLVFYPPFRAILITMIVYLVIFLVVTIYTILFVQGKETNMNLNASEPKLSEPIGNQYLTTIGILLVFFSYVGLISLMKIVKWTNYGGFEGGNPFLIGSSFLVILSCLCLGIYLFFNQTVVHLNLFIRKLSIMLKGNRVLALSNLSYRLKNNSLVYFLIVVSATVALVTITVTLSLSKSIIYGTDQEASIAYVYEGINVKNEEDLAFHEKNVDFIKKTIEAGGFNPQTTVFQEGWSAIIQSVQYIPKFYDDTMSFKETAANGGSWKSLLLMPLAIYNEMADFKGEPALALKNNHQLLLLSGPEWDTRREFNGIMEFPEGKKRTKIPVAFNFVQGKFNLGGDYPNIAVVSDDLAERVRAGAQWELAQSRLERAKSDPEETAVMKGEFFPLHIIDYNEWPENSQIDRVIESFMTERSESFELAFERGEDSTLLSYKSAYQTKQQNRKEEGLTILVSLIIGSVFFIFSVSTIYFRIYSELDRDIRYHKTLHIIGIPEKRRQELVTIELATLFFLPFVIAILNFFVIMWGFNLIRSLTSVGMIGKLLIIFILFQLLFFVIVRHTYIKAINHGIE